MTRKHFKAIASAIASLPRQEDRDRLIAYWLPYLQSINPRFNPSRFIQACQPTKG